MTATEAESTSTTDELDEDLTHTVCCEDDEIALCGIRVGDLPWDLLGESEDCPVCEHLDQVGRKDAVYQDDYCTKICPRLLFKDLSTE